MIQQSVFAIALGLTVAGCGPDLRRGEKLAARDFKDPGSAQFRDVRPGRGGAICGAVNGKNAYGAYTGFKRFVAPLNATSAMIEPEPKMADEQQRSEVQRCQDSSGLGYSTEHAACSGVAKITDQINAHMAFNSAFRGACS